MTDQERTLEGKTALVTGAALRIGRATALALADAGANVVIHYRRSKAEAAELAAIVRERGRDAWCLGADLAKPSAMARLFTRAAAAAGPIDLLVNNASVFPEDDLKELTAESLEANVRLHAVAPLALGRALAAQGRDGAIVNLLDARVADYDAAHVSYNLSKRLLRALTGMMAIEFAPRVRVNAVAPGLILPPPGKDTAYLERLASTNLLGRYGSPAGVARAVRFLLESDFITGQIIFVDGGRHLRGTLNG